MVVEKFDIADPLSTRVILERYNIRAQKSLGQNFLCDPGVINQIIATAAIDSQDVILEIGPGIGGLTQQLAKSAAQVYALEIDQHLIPILRENLADFSNIQIIPADILQVDLMKFFLEHNLEQRSVKVVANLPYYITTPVLLKVLQAQVSFTQLVLMMQKEVAVRVCAHPHHREYGALSVLVQARSIPQITQVVPRQSFIPTPKVNSAVVNFDISAPSPVAIADYSQFEHFVQAIFHQKRKTLKNNLISYLGKTPIHLQRLQNIYKQLGYQPNIRAEQLSLQQIVELQQAIKCKIPT